MRSVSVAAALVGFVLTACGAAEPAGEQPPAPSPTTGSSVGPAPTTEAVPGTGEPYDPAAQVRPELMTVTPDEAAPGDHVALMFPEQTERGVAYVLERAVGESWSTTHFLTSSTDGYGSTPTAVPVDAAESYAWEDIGIGGPGPDRLVIPDDAVPGPYRICTANALENFCAEINVVETNTDTTSPVTPTSETTKPETTSPDTTSPDTTTPDTTTPDTTTPDTTTPDTTLAPVPIVAVYDDVEYYIACADVPVTVDGVLWYPVAEWGNERTAELFKEITSVDREHPGGPVGFAPRVAPPGPGDDIGTLYVYADGYAWFESDSGVTIWMTHDEITYNWVC